MDFNVSDQVYDNFKEFVSTKEYTYTTKTEKSLDKLIEQAKKDKYYDLLKEEFDRLQGSLTDSKSEDLENNRSEIKELLEYEIAKRYYFEKAKIEVTFDDDPDWAETKSILTTNRYNELLVTQ